MSGRSIRKFERFLYTITGESQKNETMGLYKWVGNDIMEFYVVHEDGAETTTICNTDSAERADSITKALNYFKANNYGEPELETQDDAPENRKRAELIKVTTEHGWGKWRFNLVGGNGEIVAVSETYASKQKAKQTLKTCFPDFKTIVEPVEPEDENQKV